MAGATFSRVKNWTTEVLTYADLNAEIDNILNNLGPAGIDDYSASIASMKLTTDPGENGSESLATSLAGELERLRFAIKEIKGSAVSFWYESSSTSLSEIASSLGGSLNPNRISSGLLNSANQPVYLVPNGSTTSITLSASATAPLTYIIDGTSYNITSSTTITGLSAAPSTNNTCLINDTNAVGGTLTKRLGMYDSQISIDSAGSEIASVVGKTAIFQLVSNGSTEYFEAYVNSTSMLTRARRGIFMNQSSAFVPAITFSDNETVTLLRATYVFAKTDGTLVVTYNRPTYAAAQPSSPTTGDYWYDLDNGTWKTYNSVSWIAANATLIGICAQTTAATVAARAEDISTSFDPLNTLHLEVSGVSSVRTKRSAGRVSVNGNDLNYRVGGVSWDISTDLESGVSESASQKYFLYLSDVGAPKVSNKPPVDFRDTRQGFYHPENMWRCVGHIDNGSGSDFDTASLVYFAATNGLGFYSNDLMPIGTIQPTGSVNLLPGWLKTDGSAASKYEYARLFQEISTAFGTSTDIFNLPDTRGRFLRAQDESVGRDPDAGSRSTSNTGGNSGDNVGSTQSGGNAAHNHQFWGGTGGGLPTNVAAGKGFIADSDNTTYAYTNVFGGTSAVGIQTVGGNEARPLNLYVRYLIKARM